MTDGRTTGQSTSVRRVRSQPHALAVAMIAGLPSARRAIKINPIQACGRSDLYGQTGSIA
jgi:hypothetical protein